jgi:hypothetical protein
MANQKSERKLVFCWLVTGPVVPVRTYRGSLTQPWRLLAFLTVTGYALSGWSQQLSQARQPITFLELNDVHITLNDESSKYPSKVIEAMNREGAAFTLVCGDLATDGKRVSWRRQKWFSIGWLGPIIR